MLCRGLTRAHCGAGWFLQWAEVHMSWWVASSIFTNSWSCRRRVYDIRSFPSSNVAAYGALLFKIIDLELVLNHVPRFLVFELALLLRPVVNYRVRRNHPLRVNPISSPLSRNECGSVTLALHLQTNTGRKNLLGYTDEPCGKLGEQPRWADVQMCYATW